MDLGLSTVPCCTEEEGGDGQSPALLDQQWCAHKTPHGMAIQHSGPLLRNTHTLPCVSTKPASHPHTHLYTGCPQNHPMRGVSHRGHPPTPPICDVSEDCHLQPGNRSLDVPLPSPLEMHTPNGVQLGTSAPTRLNLPLPMLCARCTSHDSIRQRLPRGQVWFLSLSI